MQREKASKTNKNGKKELVSNNETTTAAAAPVATQMETFVFRNTECRLKLIWDPLHIQYPWIHVNISRCFFRLFYYFILLLCTRPSAVSSRRRFCMNFQNGFINEIYVWKNRIVGACHNALLPFSAHWLFLLLSLHFFCYSSRSRWPHIETASLRISHPSSLSTIRMAAKLIKCT